MTPKQKQLKKRVVHLSAFRGYITLNSGGGALWQFLGKNAWELREYIESLWQPGMTWDNYKKEWCVDHIVSLKYFDMFDENDLKLCWNFNNLRPMWMEHNHIKDHCVNISEGILKGMEQNKWVKNLREKIKPMLPMFDPYYETKL